MRTTASLLLLLLPLAAPAATNRPPFEPTASYTETRMEGWTVRVSSRLVAQPELDRLVRLEIGGQLARVRRQLPAAAVDRLTNVVFWLELDGPVAGGCHHPSRGWLVENGFNPDKAGGIEFGNARHALDWVRDQPCMALHELAHAYHFQVLGFGDPRPRALYEAARASGRYESVRKAHGKRQRHYALSNEKEFFAEMTESYFGVNDFFPFVYAELEDADPATARGIAELWGK